MSRQLHIIAGRTCAWSADAARCNGLLPRSPMAFTSAPAEMRACSTSALPLYAAQRRGVSPAGVRARTDAPLRMRASTPTAQHVCTAQCLHTQYNAEQQLLKIAGHIMHTLLTKCHKATKVCCCSCHNFWYKDYGIKFSAQGVAPAACANQH